MIRHARAVFMVTAVILGLPGCSPDANPSSTPASPPPNTTAVASPTTEPTPQPSPTDRHVDPIRVDWEWQQLGVAPLLEWSAASSVFDGRYLVDQARSTRRSTFVVDTADGSVVVRHRVADVEAGWIPHQAFLSDPWLIVTEANTIDRGGSLRAYRYDLRSGEHERLDTLEGFPEPGLSWSVANGLAVFDTKHLDRLVDCLVTADIETLEWRERWCGPTLKLVDWPRPGPDGTVTFRLQDEPVPEAEPCVRLFRLSLADDEEPVELPLQELCKAFSGAGGPDWTAWSEVGLRAEFIGRSKGFAQLPDGTILSLGRVQTGTITACGDWVYWQDDVAARSSERLYRWRPGREAEIVFETPVNSLLGTQQCANGWLTVVVADEGATETTYAALPPD